MATFNMGKDAGDIQEPELLPEDWYPFEITEEPAVAPNRAMKDGGADADKAGYNIVVHVACLDETPEFLGRPFTVWLLVPTEKDKVERNRMGQTKEDAKIQRNTQFTEAFGGEVDGENISLEKGLRGMLYVIQQVGQDGQTLENSISFFTEAKPYSGEARLPTDDVPF